MVVFFCLPISRHTTSDVEGTEGDVRSNGAHEMISRWYTDEQFFSCNNFAYLFIYLFIFLKID